MKYYPNNTVSAVSIDKVIFHKDALQLSQRMSSRISQSAAFLSDGEFIGWQMAVPKDGVASISLFASAEITSKDLAWMGELVGMTEPVAEIPSDSWIDDYILYELSLVTHKTVKAGIGFSSPETRILTGINLPQYFSSQFEQIIDALRQTGGVFRVVTGNCSEADKQNCDLQVRNSRKIAPDLEDSYIASPVKIRAFLCIPSPISLRLQTVLSSAVPGMEIQSLGNLNSSAIAEEWNAPLANGGDILPNYAARILMLEPVVMNRSAMGIDICDESIDPIPFSEDISEVSDSVIIGKAYNTACQLIDIKIPEIDLKRHWQLVGQSGTGKSTALISFMLNVIKTDKKYGLTFIDPHGETIDKLLRRIPKEDAYRVRVVHIGGDHTVPINIWNADRPEEAEKQINDLCEYFVTTFSKEFCGPRFERFFTLTAKACIAYFGKQANFNTILAIAQDKDLMKELASQLPKEYDDVKLGLQNEYINNGSNDYETLVNWFVSKLQRFHNVKQVRDCLNTGANALNFKETIDTDTITLISLDSPIIGSLSAKTIGSILLIQIWSAILERRNRDLTHFLVLDEAHCFQTTLNHILAEGRKFGVSATIAHQHCSQMDQAIRDALEANCANFSAFRLSPKDALIAAERFNQRQLSTSLCSLSAFSAITTVSTSGKQTSPFTMLTTVDPEEPGGNEIALEIERASIKALSAPFWNIHPLTPSEISGMIRGGLIQDIMKPSQMKQLDKNKDFTWEDVFVYDDEDYGVTPEPTKKETSANVEPSIDELELSNRSRNGLYRSGVFTIRQLSELPEECLRKARNITNKMYDEIQASLNEYLLHHPLPPAKKAI